MLDPLLMLRTVSIRPYLVDIAGELPAGIVLSAMLQSKSTEYQPVNRAVDIDARAILTERQLARAIARLVRMKILQRDDARWIRLDMDVLTAYVAEWLHHES